MSKKRKIIVTIKETLEKQVTVMANSEEKAIEKVKKRYQDSEIVLDASDYQDTEFFIENKE